MSNTEWLQVGIYVALLILCTPLLGAYMAHIFSCESTLLTDLLLPIERAIYRLAGVDADAEMHWTTYAAALIAFNALGFVVVFAVQLLQGILPLNPQHLPGVPGVLAFNTAVSFMTN